MATQATQIPRATASRSSWLWFREFIRWELAPYPGRLNTVIRMTITATLVMLIVETFRIPNAFLASLYAILLARENLPATWRNGRIVLLAFAAATLYTLLGMILFRGYPMAHFFWIIGSLYLVFFVMRTTTNYAAALVFAIPIGIVLPLWDRSLPSEVQVEGTLWPVLIIAVGAGVTLATEAIYRIFDRPDPLITAIGGLLLPVQQLVQNSAGGQAPLRRIADRIHQYQVIGTGRLRLSLQRQGLGPTQRAQRSALISLVGRLIGLAGDLSCYSQAPGDDDSIRLRILSDRLAVIRTELRTSGGISRCPHVLVGPPSTSLPVLQDMERTVALITEVFEWNAIADDSRGASGKEWWRSLFLPDAFQNPEYRRFAFGGCLAAVTCYVLYNAIDWPGIGQTAVLTCIVTAFTTIGNSVQAQFLRFAGFVAGGVIMGISAQCLILPSLDTVFGFAVFFAVGTALAAWVTTSSPRLSFFGVQMALSFYFVNLQDSHIQTDLTIARDKVMGVLLGILAMGLIFDRFGAKSDEDQLEKLLVRNVRLLAQLTVYPSDRDRASQASPLRYQINDNFASLESQMDTARFEFGFRHQREEDANECQRIQKVQPWLRCIYLLVLSLHSHGLRRGTDSESTPEQKHALELFLNEYRDKLVHIAAWIAREEGPPAAIGDESVQILRQAFASRSSQNSQAIDDICKKMISSFLMLRNAC